MTCWPISRSGILCFEKSESQNEQVRPRWHVGHVGIVVNADEIHTVGSQARACRISIVYVLSISRVESVIILPDEKTRTGQNDQHHFIVSSSDIRRRAVTYWGAPICVGIFVALGGSEACLGCQWRRRVIKTGQLCRILFDEARARLIVI